VKKRLNFKEMLPHFIALVFVTLLPLLLFNESGARINFWVRKYYLHLVFFILIFYLNYLYIVPNFFLKNKKLKFLIISLALLCSSVVLSQVISDSFVSLRPPIIAEKIILDAPEAHNMELKNKIIHPRIIDDFLYLIMVIGFSTGMGVIQKSRQDEMKQRELEKNNAETELAFLKNQISPHFFFNSLNNIYALVAINAEQAQKAIEKLSGLMRYLIYESDVETVPLKKEFEFTHNYIDLMQQRLSSKVKLNVDIQEDIPNLEIAPLIFIHFIENAFKHGISYRENSFINIKLNVQDEKILFECKNSIPKIAKPSREKGGLGIENIRKRLDLLYGSRARLDLRIEENTYIAELTIPTGQKA